MSHRRRAAVAVLLLAAIFGLCVHYDATEERRWDSPTSDELAAEYDAHVGERTLVFGTVERVDSDARTATVSVEHDGGEFAMTLRGFDRDVEPGGTVQAYGTLEAGRTMTVSESVVVNPDGGAALYKYAVSAVGALGILALFFRRWRVDPATLSFVPRDGSAGGDAGDGTAVRGGGTDDA
ncbi:hypothetical protein [Halostella litorea]|uniref:hypothetical protein n=1 Tax=Halostella litorea TaxID=2528831 RepID=UPI00109211A6|nr:hypothetical protein [Halostella litorea]